MPGASAGHAATVSQPSQPSQMEPDHASRRLLEEPPPSGLRARHNIPEVHDASVAVSGAVRQHEKRIDKKSFDYIVRSGVAGGLAGCAVSTRSYYETQGTNRLDCRLRLSSRLSIESRSYSRPRTHNLPNIQVDGMVYFVPCEISAGLMACKVFSEVILLLCYEYFHMLASNF